MKGPLRFGNVILCEYATLGDRNKYTIVNTYAGDIRVKAFPSTIQFGLYIEAICQIIGPITTKVSIFLDAAKQGDLVASIPATRVDEVGIILLNGVPIHIEKAGRLKVIAYPEGGRSIKLIDKAVSLDPTL